MIVFKSWCEDHLIDKKICGSLISNLIYIVKSQLLEWKSAINNLKKKLKYKRKANNQTKLFSFKR